MNNNWSPSSWRKKNALHMPMYGDEKHLDKDLFEVIFNIQSVLRKYVKRGDDLKRSMFAAHNIGFKASHIYKEEVGMCSEFSLLGHFLLRNLGISSSIIGSLMKTEAKPKLERHAMLYLGEYNQPIVFDIFNPVFGGGAALPSVYISHSTDFDLEETLFNPEGGEAKMQRMPNFNHPSFPKKMTIYTDRYQS